MEKERMGTLLETALNYLSEMVSRGDLYQVLRQSLGMTNREIAALDMNWLEADFEYEWEPDSIQHQYAERLDAILPEHTVLTTSRWIEFAEELAESTASSFNEEAENIIQAFQYISERHSASAVKSVYETICVDQNALLAGEIVQAAPFAENGYTPQELGALASRGAFEGGLMPWRTHGEDSCLWEAEAHPSEQGQQMSGMR